MYVKISRYVQQDMCKTLHILFYLSREAFSCYNGANHDFARTCARSYSMGFTGAGQAGACEKSVSGKLSDSCYLMRRMCDV